VSLEARQIFAVPVWCFVVDHTVTVWSPIASWTLVGPEFGNSVARIAHSVMLVLQGGLGTRLMASRRAFVR